MKKQKITNEYRVRENKEFLNLRLTDIFRNMIISFIDCINDFSNINNLFKKKNLYSNNLYNIISTVLKIFTKNHRGIYLGSFFIILSFLLYVFNILWLGG